MKNNTPYIIVRDMDVLKYLACGPAFSDDLYMRVFVKGGKLVHRKIFEIRMKKLQAAGYFQSIQPKKNRGEGPQNNGRIYTITERCRDLLTNEGRVNIDRIRLVDLKKRSFPREMILTRLVRKICELDGPNYQVTRLYDDGMMSKWIPREKIRWIPDLLLTVQMEDELSFSFLLELDKGSTRAAEFSQKLVAFARINWVFSPVNRREPFGIFIVCDTEDRMRFLQRVVEENSLTAKIKSLIAFNTIYNLENSPDPLNSWYRADGTKIEMIFTEMDQLCGEQVGEEEEFADLFKFARGDSNLIEF